jgi:hypothetical protein
MSFSLTPGNPYVNQGQINRLASSITVPLFPTLQIVNSNLGKKMIRWEPEGQATDEIETATGVVQSPIPFQMVTVTANLLRTQSLSLLWRAQMELLSTIGDILVTTDATGFIPYTLVNCAIRSAPPLDFAGQDADYNVVLRGVYYINSSLFAGS